ncbi:histidine protein kinase [Rhodovulum sp. PH10]|uniref:PAS domain S-box protein n=1 Tax=Rhodovulum sp. PH10 TaxID=1187851 RepID=UPI00027C1F41|nr:PAS domain S-box protein [Rhodovulum sp. PH10]EJW09527.1 histidine protein kinase [Rhodovulum sp. PH10]
MILESGPSGLILTDSAARILYVNAYVEEATGYAPGELIGQPIEVLVPDRFKAQHPELRRVFEAAPRERPMGIGRDLTARRKDGSELPVEIALQPMVIEGAAYTLASLVDISERKRTEERQRLLIGELNHRIQNLFAVIQSVALSSLSGERSLSEARDVFIDRLQSLGRAYTMMTEQEWRGAPLRQILAAEISAFSDRVTLAGVEVMVKQNAAQSFALLLHELTTNAVKYGALSAPKGSIAVEWRVEREPVPNAFVLSWQEHGGPDVVPPTRSGYGRKIIEDTMRRIGKHQIEYAPDGLRYRMEAPLEKVGWVVEDVSPPV